MNVLVFGASGRVGRRAVRIALENGHAVNAFVRRPDEARLLFGEATGAALTITGGDVLAASDVLRAMEGQDAVISALSVRGFSQSSFGQQGEGAATMLDAMKNITSAMAEKGVKRIITVAVSGILPQEAGSPQLIRDLPDYPQVFASSSEVHLAAYHMLVHSDLDWTIVCPGHMPEGDPTGSYMTAAEIRPVAGDKKIPEMFSRSSGGISTGDVAGFIVSELASAVYSRKRVGIVSILQPEG